MATATATYRSNRNYKTVSAAKMGLNRAQKNGNTIIHTHTAKNGNKGNIVQTPEAKGNVRYLNLENANGAKFSRRVDELDIPFGMNHRAFLCMSVRKGMANPRKAKV